MTKQELVDILFQVDVEIYPKALQTGNPEIDYGERDAYKNGWNDGSSKILHAMWEVLGKADLEISRPETMFLLYKDDMFLHMNDKWYINLSDTWYYASADWEEIPPEKYEEVFKLVKHFGYYGLLYWVYQQRGHYPQIPEIEERVKAAEQTLSSFSPSFW